MRESHYDYGRYDRRSEAERADERYEAEVEAAGSGGFKPFYECLELVLRRLQTAYEIRPQCESPIEIIMGAALIRLNELEHGGKTIITPQHPFGRYRFDWSLSFQELPHPVVFIECDGFAYHSTPEQLARDKDKDAFALQAGIEVLRFSGSDIFRNPDGCARVALAAAMLKA
jgi:very-short-patch-repair endonuclease